MNRDLEGVFRHFPVLKNRQKQYAGTMSGGEQQMLAIARALMGRPRILLLDEPSMGLAPLLVETIFETVEKLHQEGVTILLVEQNALIALSTASRGYVMQTGEIVLADQADRLLQDDMIRKVYLGEE
jgi:branched-chain amino acid transport system ATP-binding protein